MPIEARCPHMFLRSVIPCPVCDGAEQRAKAKRGKLPTGEVYDFVDLANKTVAGAQVKDRAPNVDGNARWRCICGCGQPFIEEGTSLRQKEKEGRIASCQTCKPLHRKRPSRVGVPNPNLSFRPIPAEHAEPAPKVAQTACSEPTGSIPSLSLVGDRVLRWWRIELDAKGSVVSCTAVEHRGEEGDRQFLYVEAHDQQEAGRLAWNAYCRRAQHRHRAKMTREGKCPWCGRGQDRKPGTRCGTCLANDRERAAQKKLRKAGADVAAPDAAATRAARAASERAEHRIEVLREVRSWAMDRSPRELMRWLNSQIDGQVTAKREAS